MRLRFVAAALNACALLSCPDFGQEKLNDAVTVKGCPVSHPGGRRIVSDRQLVVFYVPRLAKVKKVRDIDYVEYYVHYGPEQDDSWLEFMFGPLVGGGLPHDPGNSSIKWTTQKWGCQDVKGTDSRGTGSGRKWRHISIPFGFATYGNAPPKAANYFDKILDTMCCGKCPVCEK